MERISSYIFFLMLIVFVAGLFFSPAKKWIMLSFILFISNMMPPQFGETINTLIGPLEFMREESRILCLVFTFVLIFIPSTKDGWELKLPSKPFFIYFVLQIYLLLVDSLRISDVDMEEKFLRVAANILFFVVLGMKLATWLNNFEDAKLFFKSVVGCGIMFILVSSVQFLADPTQVVWQQRFLGVAGHPNFAGELLAITIIPSFWFLQIAEKNREKVLWLLLLLLCFVGVVWTGSRTACLMVVAGISILLLKGKKWIFPILFIGLIVALIAIYNYLPEFSYSLRRLFSGENTRQEAWAYLFSEYIDNPLFGIPTNEIHFSENSYLWIGLRGGIFALALLFWAFGLIFKSMKLQIKKANPKFKNIENLLLSCYGALFVGSIFEGYLNMTIGYQILIFYCFMTFLHRLPYLDQQPKVGFKNKLRLS